MYLQPVPLADIEQMSLVTVTWEDELSRCVRIHLPTSDEKVIKMTSFCIGLFSNACCLCKLYVMLNGRMILNEVVCFSFYLIVLYQLFMLKHSPHVISHAHQEIILLTSGKGYYEYGYK
jgi:hypothetical protein